MTAPNIVT